MATVRNNLQMKLKGKVGAYSFYTTTGNRQVARVAENSTNYGESASRSEAQQSRRARWANLVNFYKANSAWMKKAFENKKSNQSDYNKLVSLNINASPVYLTKNMYANGGCVVARYRVSDGSLSPITDAYANLYLYSTISTGLTSITSSTTIKEFSQDVLEKNNFLQEGDQISSIVMINEVGLDGIPRVITDCAEVTLDKSSSATFADLVNYDQFTVNNGRLASELDEGILSGVFILSRKTSSGLRVSSEAMQLVSSDLLNTYSSDEAKADSIASYTMNEQSFLDPGSEEQGTGYKRGDLVNIVIVKAPMDACTITGDGIATVGTQHTVTATPASGYEFKQWMIGSTVVSTSASYTFEVEGPVTLIANCTAV